MRRGLLPYCVLAMLRDTERSAAGPPRRYYQLTEAGRTALAGFTRDWTQLRDSVDTLLGSRQKDTP